MNYTIFALKLVTISLLLVMELGDPIPANGQADTAGVEIQRSHKVKIPVGIPSDLWRRSIPANNPLSPSKVALGEELYFDKRLSRDLSISCASCHDPASAFTDHNPTAIGQTGTFGTRNAPTILNAMFNEMQFWDGRARSLEQQAKQPLINPMEMGMPSYDAVVARVSSIPSYRQKFGRVFKSEGITIDTIVRAIAAFERTQLSGNSPFDRFIKGDQTAITDGQKQGWQLFKSKGKCIECHSFANSSPFFTDFKFHNSGIGVNAKGPEQLTYASQKIIASSRSDDVDPAVMAHRIDFSELGRFLVTKQPKDIGAFKTPTLRDVELTAPYMHNGSLRTLLDVVRYYNRGGEKNANLDEKIRPLGLSDEEMSHIVEFLRALTSDDVLKQTQLSKPQTRSVVTASP